MQRGSAERLHGAREERAPRAGRRTVVSFPSPVSASAVLVRVTLGLLLLGLVAPTGHAEVEAFEITPPLSRDGVYALSWTADGEVVLEEAGDDAFRDVHVVYRGADEGTVLTGRPEGVYFYRVRAAGAPESEAVRAFVQVEHHSFGRALVFFVVGLVVFVSTIGLVVRGPDERREESEGAGGSGGGASPGSETQGGRANG